MRSIHENYDLKRRTTFHVDASAGRFAEYDSVSGLVELLALIKASGSKMFHMGGGSNLLFTKPFDGYVLHSLIKGIEIVEHNADSVIVRVGAGVVWDDFVEWTTENDLYGAECLSAIPGEVGASAVQNIGAYGVEAKDIIERVHCIDTQTLEAITFANAECAYGYRDSLFKKPEVAGRFIVTHVDYRLSATPRFTLTYGPLRELEGANGLTAAAVRQRVIEIRRSKLPDPEEQGNAGSFFKNPAISEEAFRRLKTEHPDAPGYVNADGTIKVHAGWLIEHAGLKGAMEGKAMVYPKQCLVIVNSGGATASDVIALSAKVVKTVDEVFNIKLHPEVIFI